jgi:hypothetical protein
MMGLCLELKDGEIIRKHDFRRRVKSIEPSIRIMRALIRHQLVTRGQCTRLILPRTLASDHETPSSRYWLPTRRGVEKLRATRKQTLSITQRMEEEREWS